MTGFSMHEVIGHNCRFLQGRETNPKTVMEIRRCIDECEEITRIILNYRKDGTPFYNLVSISPVFGEEAFSALAAREHRYMRELRAADLRVPTTELPSPAPDSEQLRPRPLYFVGLQIDVSEYSHDKVARIGAFNERRTQQIVEGIKCELLRSPLQPPLSLPLRSHGVAIIRIRHCF